jgi:hypothetical protein
MIGTFLRVAVVGILLSSVSYAADTYTTSTGAVFTQVQGPGTFGDAWKDPSGMMWSSNQGKFENDQNDANNLNQPPLLDAAQACAKIGGILPSLDNYKKLMSYFELDESQQFTKQGLKDLVALFPDTRSDIWWTSSPSPEYPWDPAYFSSELGCKQLYDFRSQFEESVRCIAQ